MRWQMNGNRRNNQRGFQLSEILERRMLLAAELVCDVNPGAADAFMQWYSPGGSEGLCIDKLALNQTLFFNANDGQHPGELWKTDGTAAGTALVKDINPDGAAMSVYGNGFTGCNGRLFFSADDGKHGIEVWKSDGTAAGTVMVKDIHPGKHSGLSSWGVSLTEINGVVYFEADDGPHGIELWRTDGTAEGTWMVADISPGETGSYPTNRVCINGAVYFFANDGNGGALWRTDGTPAGTKMLQRVSTDLSLLYTTVVGNTFYFVGFDAAHGSELWKSDGTPAGTGVLKEIHPGAEYGYAPSLPVLVNGQLYFYGHDGSHGWELWRSDGTTDGTAMIKDIQPDEFAGTSGLWDLNGEMLFIADDGVHGQELWKTNGTAAGTTMVTDINPGGDADFFGGYEYETRFQPLIVNRSLFFCALDGAHGRELWTSDGTAAGTRMVKDIKPGPSSSELTDPVVFGGRIFFWDADGKLWRSDGTSVGTVMVKDVGAFASDETRRPQVYDASLLFIAAGKLWQSDGTTPGTNAILTLKSWIPDLDSGVSRIDNQLYFVASDGASGLELWRTDVPYAAVVEGVLRIVGTESDDTIGLTIRSETLRVRRNGVISTFAAAEVSRIEIEALAGNDVIDWSGISIPTYVDAGAGNDLVTAGSGKDSLTGGAGKDSLYGGEGDDRINGYGTNDKLFGQGGNDRIYGGAHNDYIDGGGGVDRIWGEDGNDTLCGSSSNDKINGGLGDDSILGGKGNDLLTCGGGADTLFGNDGDDSLVAVDSLRDVIDGGLGDDQAQVDEALDQLSGVET